MDLKKLIGMLDEIEWATLDVDLKGETYEGLLQKMRNGDCRTRSHVGVLIPQAHDVSVTIR